MLKVSLPGQNSQNACRLEFRCHLHGKSLHSNVIPAQAGIQTVIYYCVGVASGFPPARE